MAQHGLRALLSVLVVVPLCIKDVKKMKDEKDEKEVCSKVYKPSEQMNSKHELKT